jgi:cysteine-rich repeat protein
MRARWSWSMTRQARAGLAILGAALAASPASAICDVIPGAAAEFRSALGATNRPYAGPGDFLEVAVRAAVCDDESTGLATLATDNLVTVLFTPTGAPVSAVLVASDCGLLGAGTCVGGSVPGAPCRTNGECGGGTCTGPSALSVCQSQLGSGGAASCVAAGAGDLAIERDGVSERITFRFPDTDAAVDGPSDDRTLAGPAKVVVTQDTKPLVCGAALQPCSALARQSAAACIDRFFALDGSCGTANSQLAQPFSGFTALPNSNDYQKLCESSDPSSPCTPDPTLEVRFTIDRDGNVLVPMNWRGVRLFQDGNPVARLAEGETSIDAFVTGLLAGTPIDVPGDSFVASFSPNGFPVAPAFTPVADEEEASAAKLFGSVDADRGVMRIARRSASLRECLDASGLPPSPAGIPCNDAGDCPAGLSCGDPGESFCRNRATQVRSAQSCAADGACSAAGQECSPALFAFEGRGAGQGKGPVVIPNADFEATVGTPVPLEGLLESDEVFAFGLSEPLDGEDRNGDLDAVDFIATLGDKQGGLGTLLSPVVRLHDGRFRYPALDVEADILAYLEPEQGRLFEFAGAIPSPACILNQDGDCFDSLPRVFRQPDGGAAPEEIFVGALPADALPIVNGKSIAIMDGRVFFRSPEPDQAPRLLERESLLPGGGPSLLPAIPQDVSEDGTRVAFSSQDRLVAAKHGGQRDGFVRDRATGEMLWASVDRFGGDPNGTVENLRLSGDGLHAFFDSSATDLVEETGGAPPGLRRLFVRDLAAGVTSLLEIGGDGLPSADASLEDVSADGRFVVFRSAASELFGGDPVPGDVHVYRFDRQTGATDLVDARQGSPASGDAEDAALSDDGRFVAFVSTATDLLQGGAADANGAVADTFVRDMASDGVELASVATGGSPQANGPSIAVSLSPDGRTVAFSAFATNLDSHVTPVAGSTVYVRDRSADVTFAVQQLAGPVGATPSLGGAGRYLGATSDVLIGLNPFLVARSLFRGDLLTGIVELVDALGLEDFIVLERALLSGDGHTTLFSDLGLPAPGAFVKSFDDGSPSADFSGDGDARDTLLVTVDTGDAGGTDVLCPAAKVDLGDGFALFLRPERDGESPENPLCPSATGLPGDFSGDGDLLDQVAHLRRPDSVLLNLELAARDVAVTGSIAAALGSEADERRPGQSDGEASFNGDDDALDDVLFVAPVDDVSGREDWTVVPLAGKALDASGDLAGILSCEADQGGDTTDDEDSSDCSLQLYDGIALSDPFAGGLLDLADAEGRQRPADDFVMGSAERRCVAPASPATACSESADCPAGSFCGAAGACISVLSEPASCSGDGDCAAGASCERDEVVAFRGSESDLCNAPPASCNVDGVPPGCDDVAECDRNGDGDCCDDTLFAFDLLQGRVVASGQAITPCRLQACDPRLPYRVFTPSATVRFLTLEADQGGDDLDADGSSDGLVVQVWNVRGGAVQTVATVSDEADPGPNDPTVDPLAGGSEQEPGTQIFSSFGLCIESLGDGACPPEGFREEGICRVVHGVCASDGDCPPGVPCDRTQRITVAVADEDGDGLPDPIDNCPGATNSDQTDEDGDAQGDACDTRICGDGDLDPGEQCDDGDLDDGDGCSRFCQSERRVCDANGDGSVDQRDISKILRERGQTAVQPYDPRDVDLDGQITVLDSRTCVRECDRANCAAPPPPAPGPPGCGLLGGEALLALLPFWLWRRRAAARRAGLALAVALALVVVGGAPAGAVTLALVPSAVAVAVGGNFDLDLVVGGLGDGVAPSLGGFDVALSFDSDLLSLDSVQLGALLGDENAFESFSDVVFATGSVSIAQTSFLDALVLDGIQPASFTIASLSFTAIAAGTSAVGFASASLADAFGAPLQVTVAGARVNAGGVIPEPSASLLFGFGALAVAAAARRVRRAR